MIEAHLIYVKGHPESTRQANECLESHRLVKNKFNITPLEATTKHTVDWKSMGVDYKHLYGFRGPNMEACTHSHYRIWQKALETMKPVLLLEHDALFMQEFTEAHLDMIQRSPYKIVSLYSSLGPENIIDNGFEDIQGLRTCVMTHGYVITPGGAQLLMDTIHGEGEISQHDRRHFAAKLNPHMGGFKEKIILEGVAHNARNLKLSKEEYL